MNLKSWPIWSSWPWHDKYSHLWTLSFLLNEIKQMFFLSIKKEEEDFEILPIYFFTTHLWNSLYDYLIKNALVSLNQSGFNSEDSCTNQLSTITNKRYQTHDNGFEIRRHFSWHTSFDKVWHKDFTCMLIYNGVADNVLNT